MAALPEAMIESLPHRVGVVVKSAGRSTGPVCPPGEGNGSIILLTQVLLRIALDRLR